MLGLSKDWAYKVIKGVGNYGEIYDRHIGPKTADRPRPGRQPALDQGRHPLRPAVPLEN